MNIPFNNLDRKGAPRAVETQSSSVVSTIKGFFHDKLLKARTMALNTVAASVVTMQSAKAVFHDRFTKTAQVERVAEIAPAQETVETTEPMAYEEYVEEMPYGIDYSEEVDEWTAYMAEEEAPYVEEVLAYRAVDEEQAPTKASKKLFNIPFVKASSNEKAGAETFALPEKEKNEELPVRLQKLEAAIKDPNTSVFDVPRLVAEFTGKSVEEVLTDPFGLVLTPGQFAYSILNMDEAIEIEQGLIKEAEHTSYTELLEEKNSERRVLNFRPAKRAKISLFKEEGQLLHFDRSKEGTQQRTGIRKNRIDAKIAEIFEQNAKRVVDDEPHKWIFLRWFTHPSDGEPLLDIDEKNAVSELVARNKKNNKIVKYDVSNLK